MGTTRVCTAPGNPLEFEIPPEVPKISGNLFGPHGNFLLTEREQMHPVQKLVSPVAGKVMVIMTMMYVSLQFQGLVTMSAWQLSNNIR